MAAYAGLAAQAKQLEKIQEQISESKKDSPSLILVQPLAEKVDDVQRAVYETLNRAMRSNAEPSGAAKRSEEDVSALLTQLAEELAQEPWHNPQVLRRTRKTLESLTERVAEMQELRQELKAGRGGERPTAPAMAGAMGGKKGSQAAKVDKPMGIEDALAMLLDKNKTSWQGGLVGIVHAAGVQEMTPLSAHSPGRFEFIFAPKSQAAWNLHTYATMV